VAYESAINQRAMTMRSRKLHTLQRSLKPADPVRGPGGRRSGGRMGLDARAMEEAVDRLRAEGHRVSSLCLRFLSPLEPGLSDIFKRFAQVFTVELNYATTATIRGCTGESPVRPARHAGCAARRCTTSTAGRGFRRGAGSGSSNARFARRLTAPAARA